MRTAPLSVGVESLLGEGTGASVTAGATVSIVNLTGALEPLLPAPSLCVAWVVYTPSASWPVVNDHFPPLAVKVPEEAIAPPTDDPR